MDVLSVLKCRLEIVDDSVSSKELVDRVVALGPREEPLHLVELDTVVKRHYDWIRHLPRVRPFYAIKSNNEASIVETTLLLGCGYDCASKAECQRVLGFGVDRERIIFNQPAKTIESLEYAREKRLRTVFDSEFELRKIHQYYSDAEVLIRFRFVLPKTKATLGVKFGCNPNREARELLDLAKELGINVIGWCVNVGAGCEHPEIFYGAIEAGRRITDYASSLGFSFNYIDLGGGFHGDKDSNNVPIYAAHINRALEEFFPDEQRWTIIAEPGRYYTAACMCSVIPVHGKRVFRSADNPALIEKVYYYFNDGIYGTFYSAKYHDQPVKPIIWKKRSDCGPEYNTFFYGPTCDGNDVFAADISLPELNISDYVVFENLGAYTKVYSCRFNGFCLPRSIVFIRKSVWDLLQSISLVDNPDLLIRESQYLHSNNKLEELTFE
ncbi:ornithine decarboxylase 1-like [Topomyia yanbarensis]|uniref:ornithine decarboxylase 1-like n=1 Tax=Topomyia yanbarensis TaxID=2498891 RepID=UPI00273B9ADF|nr:ornithine decarboxylase 1-like [Topomyia yanbarensis]